MEHTIAKRWLICTLQSNKIDGANFREGRVAYVCHLSLNDPGQHDADQLEYSKGLPDNRNTTSANLSFDLAFDSRNIPLRSVG